jgi:hypothetical protein
MKKPRILIPIGVTLLLLLLQSGCISSTLLGTGSGDVSLTASVNSATTIANPCIPGGVWTAHDQFAVDLAVLADASVTRTVDLSGIVTRQLAIGPGLTPPKSPIDLAYVYQFENGDLSQGVLHVPIVAALSVTATATPSQIVSDRLRPIYSTQRDGDRRFAAIFLYMVPARF